jgi:hypothetical protein
MIKHFQFFYSILCKKNLCERVTSWWLPELLPPPLQSVSGEKRWKSAGCGLTWCTKLANLLEEKKNYGGGGGSFGGLLASNSTLVG